MSRPAPTGSTVDPGKDVVSLGIALVALELDRHPLLDDEDLVPEGVRLRHQRRVGDHGDA